MARRRGLSCSDVLASLDVLSDICPRSKDKKTNFICKECNNFVCEEHSKLCKGRSSRTQLNIVVQYLLDL